MRALSVAYYFPPIRGGGARRPTKFALRMREQGCAPAVLTGPKAIETIRAVST